MTKGKVIQIGLFISLIGLISYKLVPQIGIDNFTATTLSSCILILIVITWVTSYESCEWENDFYGTKEAL